jgi:hypothetical protein
MPQLTVDNATGSQFATAQDRVDIRDRGGRLLGYSLPAPDDYDGPECPLSNEELDQIEREGGGRPLSEILADLRAGETP